MILRTWHLVVATVTVGALLLAKESDFSPSTRQQSMQVSADAVEVLSPNEMVASRRRARLQSREHPIHEVQAKLATLRGVPALPLNRSSSLRGGPGVVRGRAAPVTATTAAPAARAKPAPTTADAGGPTPFMVLGIVSNVMWGNSFDRRKWIRETFLTYPNVGRSMPCRFIAGMRQSDLSPLPPALEQRLRAEVGLHGGDLLLADGVPERKSPCLKTMWWYRHAVKTWPAATFIAKTDDDAYVHTLKLEHNMRRFASQPLVYIGSTLWGSYITKTFEPCARRMGPMMCKGGMQEEKCAERGAVGPYPYAVGMLQVLSQKVAGWMVEQAEYAEFERRATAATRPPMMTEGEDMVIGMFLYHSPWPLMPLHWGWDKLHDLCFKCERKDQIWRPITHQTVVAHHVANAQIMAEVHANISARCDAACVKKELPFEVESLRDLCSRGAIRTVYSKCAMVK